MDEKHEIMGWLVAIYGCVSIALGWAVSWPQFAIIFCGTVTVLGLKRYRGLKAGPIEVSDGE